MKNLLFRILTLSFLFALNLVHSQDENRFDENDFRKILQKHREFVSLPNLPFVEGNMERNSSWISQRFVELDFKTRELPSSTLPILFAEKIFNPELKSVLFYFHMDGQAVNPEAWNQEDPFVPVLKSKTNQGNWEVIDWDNLNGSIHDDWRIFARAAADDKAPIVMLLSALEILKEENKDPSFNIKIIFDPEEEYGSKALLSTLEDYKDIYKSDYFIVMDGPGDSSNGPSLTFGCRGIATCSITTYGAKNPMHSGHYGNYVSNPVFGLSKILASMKDDDGRVLIEDYYKGVELSKKDKELMAAVPFNSEPFNSKLGIHSSEKVASTYQEALQYPTLNVRQIGTSWKKENLKTVIPGYAVAHLDVRLVPEIEGEVQLGRIKNHLIKMGYYVIDREPTDEERLTQSKIVKFSTSGYINSYRTDPENYFGKEIRTSLTDTFKADPVIIRMMGGTVPIVPLINALNVPTIIVPMVNMDNNQHSPNENIRIGNIRQGINICLSILETEL